ncbi:MAG: lysylphosphatidylglycerol synthase domain-containing protein, partial [Zestosphaera sp.]
MAVKSRLLLLTLVIAVASYVVLFLVMYASDLSAAASVLWRAESIGYVSLALATRMASVTLHALTFFILVRVFEPVNLIDVVKITYISVFTELVLPVGGVTEVVKFALLGRYASLPSSKAVLSITLHRIITTLTMFSLLVISLSGLGLALPGTLILVLPAVVLLSLNLGLLALPRSKKLEDFLNKLLSRVRTGGRLRFYEEYNSRLSEVMKRWDLISLSVFLSLLERLANVLHGYTLSLLTGATLNAWQLTLGFDSIYMIIWLLPIVTPGNMGIYEL